jgi:hypothetical protein
MHGGAPARSKRAVAGAPAVGDERKDDEREQRGGRACDHLEDELQQFEDQGESDEGTPARGPQ